MGNAGLSYSACRAHVDAGDHPPLTNSGCVAGCINTAEMAALEPQPVTEPEPEPEPEPNDDPGAGVIIGAAAGGVVGLVAIGGIGYYLMAVKGAKAAAATASAGKITVGMTNTAVA